MRKKLSRLILKILGWRAVLKVQIPEKCVFCVAPHTSNSDFLIGRLMYSAIGGKRPSFLIKKEWFRFPFNIIFNPMGGIPVDRNNKNSLIDQIVNIFNTQERFHLAITPEGTRKANPNWKRGFYYIAQRANVPVLLAYINYFNKTAGIEKVFIPTGNEEDDIRGIKSYYQNFQGRHPEKFAI